MLGQVMSGYTVAEKLGESAESACFLAEHRRLHRKAVLELFTERVVPSSPRVVRFFRDMREMASFKHPGACAIFDAGLHEDRIYLVREELAGETLDVALKRAGSFASEFAVALALARQVAEVLSAAHARSLLHGDLHLGRVRVLVDTSEASRAVAKVSGWGLGALHASESDIPPSREGDGRALGALLFQLLAGQSPREPRRPPSFFQPGIPPEVDGLVLALLTAPSSELQDLKPWAGRLGQLLEKDPHPISRKLLAGTFGSVAVAGEIETVDGVLPLGPLDDVEDTVVVPVDQMALPTPPLRLPPPMPTGTPRALRVPVAASPTSTLLLTDDDVSEVEVEIDPTPARALPAVRRAPAPRTRSAPRTSKRPWGMLAGLGIAAIATVLLVVVSLGPGARHRPPRERVPTRDAEKALPAYVDLEVMSEPPGADVTLPGESAPRGATPLRVRLPRGTKAVDLLVSRSGFQDKLVAADVSAPHVLEVRLEPAPAPPPVAWERVVPEPGPTVRASQSQARAAREGKASSPTLKRASAPPPRYYPMGD